MAGSDANALASLIHVIGPASNQAAALPPEHAAQPGADATLPAHVASAVDADDKGVASSPGNAHDEVTDPATRLVVSNVDDDDTAMSWTRYDWIACAVLLLGSVLLVSMHVRAYPTLSPTDELQHLDYVIKAGTFEPPHRGDLVGQEAMSEAACRSVDAPGYVGPRCGLDRHDPENFQENGVNTAASQLPLYYTITGLAARTLTDTGLLSSSVTAARMTGAVWAGAAWAVMWYLMSLLGIDRKARVISIALFMVTPLTLFHAATINADAVLLLSGALVALAAVQFDRGRLHWAWMLAAFGGLYLLEPTAMLPVGVVAGFLVLRAIGRSDIGWVQRSVPLVVLATLFVLRFEVVGRVQDLWLPISPRSATASGPVGSPSEPGVNWRLVFDQFGALFTPLNRTYIPPFLDAVVTRMFLRVTDWVAIAAMIATAFLSLTRQNRVRVLAQVTVPALIVAGPFYSWTYEFFSNAEYSAQGRFGLPLFVFIVVAVAAAIQYRRLALYVVGTIAACSMLNMVYLLATP